MARRGLERRQGTATPRLQDMAELKNTISSPWALAAKRGHRWGVGLEAELCSAH